MLSYRSTINGQDLNTILNRFTDQNVKLRQKEKSDALRSWQPIASEGDYYIQDCALGSACNHVQTDCAALKPSFSLRIFFVVS